MDVSRMNAVRRPRRRAVWWQSWWVVVPGLVLCLPLGLVGLWRRPGVSVWMRVGLTAATVGFLGIAMTADDPATRTTNEAAAAPAPASTPAAAPVETPVEPPVETAVETAVEPPLETPVETAARAAVAAPTTAPPKSIMPAVTGMSAEQAESALAAAGLAVREVRQVPSDQPVGTVLSQSRKTGMQLNAGVGVVILVAAPFPEVPGVVGLPQPQAVGRLQAAGYRVDVTTVTRTSGKNGVVMEQTPTGASRIKAGSTITLVVSSVVKPLAAPAQNCASGYRPCLPPASDYDCAGGSGDGPEYAVGPIYVTGSDPYDLDRENDGIACE